MSDTSDHRDRLARLFDLAADLPAAERDALLARECAADTALRRRVETLLRAHDAAEASPGPAETRDPAQTASVYDDSTADARDEAMAEGVGAVIGRYRLVRRLGSGTFGTVFLADQLEGVQQRVALKRLNPGMNSGQVLARFAVERQALAAMQHPNIAKVFDGGQTPGGYPYFVMEYVDGVPLTDYCEDRHLPLRRRLELFAQICSGVQHAHSRGIIHRDLKPTNILVAEYDGVATVKVIDFGIAKAVGDPVTADSPHTLLGTVIGSLPYMSPEQASFETHDVDKRADIYALGAVLYELLTGTTPLDEWLGRRSAMDALLKVIRERVPPTPSSRLLTASRAGTATRTAMDRDALAGSRAIRGDLDWIVMKALEKDRDRRYDSASAFADDVQRHLGGQPVLARRPTVRYRLGKSLRRNRRAVIAISLLLLAVVIGTIGTAKGLRRAAIARQAEAEQRSRAEDESRRAVAEADRAAAADRRKFMGEYVDDLRTLPALWSQGATDLVRSRLQRYVTAKPADDARGFEWFYWDRQTHAAVATLKAGSPATSIALSPDAHIVWFADKAGRVMAWDVLAGKQTTLAEAAGAYQVTADAAGTRLAVLRMTRRSDGQPMSDLVVIDTAGHQQATIPTRIGPFSCAAFSPDGTRIVTGDLFGDVSLWDAANGESILSLTDNQHSRRGVQNPMACLDGHTGRLSGVAFSPDGKNVASVDVESGLAVWTTGGRCVRREFDIGRNPSGVAYSADGRTVLVRQTAAAQWQSHPRAGGGLLLFTGRGRPREVSLRDEDPPSPPPTMPPVAMPGATFGVNDQTVLTAVGDTLRVVDPTNGDTIAQLRGHTSPVVALCSTGGGRIVATADASGELNLWTAQRQPGLHVDADFPGPLRALALCDTTGRRVVLTDAGANTTSSGVTAPSEDKRLTLADGDREIDVEQAVGNYVGLAASPDGKHFATAEALDGGVIVWDAATGKITRRFDPEAHADGDGVPVRVRGLAFRTDDEVYAIGPASLRRLRLSDGRAERVDAAAVGTSPSFDGMQLRLPDEAAITLGFSPDGRLAAFGYAGGNVEIVETERWTSVTRLRVHRREVTAVQFSPDGRRLVTAAGRYVVSGEGRPSDTPGGIVVWDTATWRDCLTLAVPGRDDVAGVAWTDGGHAIVAAANAIDAGTSLRGGGRVVTWDTRPPAVADALADPHAAASTPAATPGDPLTGKTLVFPSLAIARGGLVGFTSLAVHPTGDYVAAVDVRGTVVLWKARTGELLATGRLHDSSGWRIRFDADGKTLHGTTFPFGNDVGTLNVPDLSPAVTPPAAAADDKAFTGGEPVVSAAGRWQLERPDPAQRPDEVFVRDRQSGTLSERPHAAEPQLRAMVFFPDGEHFATIGGQNEVHLWSVKTPASPPKS